MIDNIMVGAREGQEALFLSAVRRILARIRAANLLTSPDRETLLQATDGELLEMASQPCVFLGEEYAWNGNGERVVRNSVKTVAKIKLSLQATRFSIRSFASVISLAMYALHTTQLNPARTFRLLLAYRGVCRLVYRGYDWDDPVPYIDDAVWQDLNAIGARLVDNTWWPVADVRSPTYNDREYNLVVYTDASVAGWGAVAQDPNTGATRTYQKRWVQDFDPTLSARWPNGVIDAKTSGFFNARHSAHAEPRAAQAVLRQLVHDGLPGGSRVALVTDHFPIVHAQRRLNGFGGIGRGYALNKLYEYTHDLWHDHKIDVVYFYLRGASNPADALSRNFGAMQTGLRESDCDDHRVVVEEAGDMGVPALINAFSPLCENLPSKAPQYNKQ